MSVDKRIGACVRGPNRGKIVSDEHFEKKAKKNKKRAPSHDAGRDPFLETVKPMARKAWRAITSGGKAWVTVKVTTIVVSLAWVGLKGIVVPTVVSHYVEDRAEAQGVSLSVEDWSADLWDLSVTAEQLTLLAAGPYEKQELMTSDFVDFDLSLFGGLFGGGWLTEVRVREPDLHLERTLSGHWNWMDLAQVQLAPEVAADLPPAQGQPGLHYAANGRGGADTPIRGSEDAESEFVVPRLLVDGMDLAWVENLPADSAGGILQDLKASLHLDDVGVTALDLRGLVDLRPAPSRLAFEARTGEGKISFDGEGNFFSWAQPAPPAEGDVFAAFDSGPLWAPRMRVNLYLENVGAAAFARLTPNAALLPVRGSMTGNVSLAVASGQVECVADLQLRNVVLAVNEKSIFIDERRRASVEAQLADYRANGQHTFACGGLLAPGDEGGDAGYRPFLAFQTNLVRQAATEAPRQVQALAAIEHARYSEEPIDPELQRDVNQIAGGVDDEVLKWLQLADDIQRVAPARRGGIPGVSGGGGALSRIRGFGGGLRRP